MPNINTKEYWDETYRKTVKFSSTTMYLLYKLIPENVSVLDIGCGTGHLMKKVLGHKKCTVYGLDISGKAIELLKQKGMEGEVADAENLDNFNKKFDVVVASHILEHLTNEDRFLENLKRIAGFVLIAVPNDSIGPEEEETHQRKYTKDQLLALLLRHFKYVEDHSNVDRFLIMKAYDSNEYTSQE